MILWLGFIPPEGASDSQITLQKIMLLNQMDEIRAKLNAWTIRSPRTQAIGMR